MSLLARAALVLCTLFLLTSPIYAKENELKARHRVELINDVSSLITEYYFFADVGEEMIVLVNEKLKRGDYDQFTTVATFADQLTQDLQSISHDRHLNVRASKAPPLDQEGLAVDEAAIEQRRFEQARLSNFGFERLKILPGNIGYIDLRSFLSASVAGDTAVAAMNFLANSSAIIFGLRQNGGGDPTMTASFQDRIRPRSPGIQPRTAFHGVQVAQMML